MAQAQLSGCPWIWTLDFLYFSLKLFVENSLFDTCKLFSMGCFAIWTYSPRRRLFENRVVHPLSLEYPPQPNFCPQDHRRRKRIRLKSLAWARHHKERLYFHPRVYAQHAANKRDWIKSARDNEWGGLWDHLPYDLWGWNPSHWYYQRHKHDTFDDCLALDIFCSSLDPLKFHQFEGIKRRWFDSSGSCEWVY